MERGAGEDRMNPTGDYKKVSDLFKEIAEILAKYSFNKQPHEENRECPMCHLN